MSVEFDMIMDLGVVDITMDNTDNIHELCRNEVIVVDAVMHVKDVLMKRLIDWASELEYALHKLEVDDAEAYEEIHELCNLVKKLEHIAYVCADCRIFVIEDLAKENKIDEMRNCLENALGSYAYSIEMLDSIMRKLHAVLGREALLFVEFRERDYCLFEHAMELLSEAHRRLSDYLCEIREVLHKFF